MKLFEVIPQVRKTIVAALSVVVLGWLNSAGVELGSDVVTQILDSAIVAVMVWFVPNSKVVESVDG